MKNLVKCLFSDFNIFSKLLIESYKISDKTITIQKKRENIGSKGSLPVKKLTLAEKRKKIAERKKKKGKSFGAKDIGPSRADINKLLLHYKSADFVKAEELALAITEQFPGHQFGWKILGMIWSQIGRKDAALDATQKSVKLAPQDAEAHNNLGNIFEKFGRLEEAEISYRKAVALKSDYAEAYYNLGSALSGLGKLEEAETSYSKAVLFKSNFPEAHNNLGGVLEELGKFEEAEASYIKAIELNTEYAEAHSNLGMRLIAKGEYDSALQCFSQSSELMRGINNCNPDSFEAFGTTSKAKLDHDIEQFEYLVSEGFETELFTRLASLYRRVGSEISWPSETEVITLGEEHQGLLRSNYNLLLHRLECNRVNESALNKFLDTEKIIEDYYRHEYGLTYFDNFLSPQALQSLQKFLLGSTIWFNVKKGGYLGAYLNEGLASPLILQIADELKKKFPEIIKEYPLNHVWAYKYDSRANKKKSSLGGISVHADFAAVNVNFWITPSAANLDPTSGGLVVYNAEAPIDWDVSAYNNYEKNKETIDSELKKNGGKKSIVPYKGNRVVLFNSNLLHETDRYTFMEGYQNRRINITMLFGNREYR